MSDNNKNQGKQTNTSANPNPQVKVLDNPVVEDLHVMDYLEILKAELSSDSNDLYASVVRSFNSAFMGSLEYCKKQIQNLTKEKELNEKLLENHLKSIGTSDTEEKVLQLELQLIKAKNQLDLAFENTNISVRKTFTDRVRQANYYKSAPLQMLSDMHMISRVQNRDESLPGIARLVNEIKDIELRIENLKASKDSKTQTLETALEALIEKINYFSSFLTESKTSSN